MWNSFLNAARMEAPTFDYTAIKGIKREAQLKLAHIRPPNPRPGHPHPGRDPRRHRPPHRHAGAARPDGMRANRILTADSIQT